jgi:hypothetical protein
LNKKEPTAGTDSNNIKHGLAVAEEESENQRRECREASCTDY